jgi:hypothetical protein
MVYHTGHEQIVCQFGIVHGQCRCAEPNTIVRNIICNRPEEHLEMSVNKKLGASVQKVEKSAVYQMFKNTDMDEGLGADVPIPGLFGTIDVAKQAAVGRGVYGQPALIKQIPIFYSVKEFENWERNGDPEYQQYLKLKQKFEN